MVIVNAEGIGFLLYFKLCQKIFLDCSTLLFTRNYQLIVFSTFLWITSANLKTIKRSVLPPNMNSSPDDVDKKSNGINFWQYSSIQLYEGQWQFIYLLVNFSSIRYTAKSPNNILLKIMSEFNKREYEPSLDDLKLPANYLGFTNRILVQ